MVACTTVGAVEMVRNGLNTKITSRENRKDLQVGGPRGVRAGRRIKATTASGPNKAMQSPSTDLGKSTEGSAQLWKGQV